MTEHSDDCTALDYFGPDLQRAEKACSCGLVAMLAVVRAAEALADATRARNESMRSTVDERVRAANLLIDKHGDVLDAVDEWKRRNGAPRGGG